MRLGCMTRAPRICERVTVPANGQKNGRSCDVRCTQTSLHSLSRINRTTATSVSRRMIATCTAAAAAAGPTDDAFQYSPTAPRWKQPPSTVLLLSLGPRDACIAVFLLDVLRKWKNEEHLVLSRYMVLNVFITVFISYLIYSDYIFHGAALVALIALHCCR